MIETKIKRTTDGMFIAGCKRCDWQSGPKFTEQSAGKSSRMHWQSAHTRSFQKARDQAYQKALMGLRHNGERTKENREDEPENPPRRKYRKRRSPPQIDWGSVLDRFPFCSGCGHNIKDQLLAHAAQAGIQI